MVEERRKWRENSGKAFETVEAGRLVTPREGVYFTSVDR